MVEEAENGRVAVEMIASSVPGYYKMVLMDIQMPVMDMMKYKEAGMNEHIANPFNRGKLEEIIGKYLNA